MTDLVGQSLGQYNILAEIAKGSMSTVYRARQTSIGRDVAIKVLPTSFMHDKTFIERFHREVDIIARLQHPHILPVYDFGEYENMPYIVMAYISGGTLTDKVKREGPLPVAEVARIVKQVADALDYAHSKGIIHRDFKPSNVLLDEQGNTYLADFGLAKLSQSNVQITGTAILGTPTYMPPEQAGSSDLTPASDVYALGVTTWQMLTGRVPYESENPMGVLIAHATQPIPKIRDMRATLTEETQSVFNLALAKTVEGRYPTPGQFAEALITALQGRADKFVTPTEEAQPALLMTNMLGQVIFVDHHCLKMLKLSHQDARTIIGRNLADVLGIPQTTAEQIIHDVSKNGQIQARQLNVKDSHGSPVAVNYSAIATYDPQKNFVGSDINLQPMVETPEGPRYPDLDSNSEALNSTEESFLQIYFTAQITALQKLLAQLGGKRLSAHMATIINETAQRNVWPVHLEGDQLTIDLKSQDADVYRALLAKAVTYATSVIGERVVKKEMNAVDAGMDGRIREYVKAYGLR